MPRELVAARVVLFVLFGFTLLYLLGVFMVGPRDGYSGEFFGLLLYDIAPSTAAAVLASRAWTGGQAVRRSIIGVEAWEIFRAVVTLSAGDTRGLSQMVLPIAAVVLLIRGTSREWFGLPLLEREEPRGFSVARMIRWRRDGGQTSMEYIGLLVVVIAVIGGLVTAGYTTEIGRTVGAKICEVVGTECGGAGGDGGTNVKAGDDGDGSTDAGTEGGADNGGGGGDGAADSGDGSGDAGGDTSGSDGAGGTANGGADESSGGDDASVQDAPQGSGGTDGSGGDGTDDVDNDKSFGDHVADFFTSPIENAWDDITSTVEDPIGSVTGAVSGLYNYGKEAISNKADEIVDKWNKGDYFSAGWAAVIAPQEIPARLAIDLVIDKENLEKGNFGAALGNTLVNGATLLSPRSLIKLKKFDKLGKLKDTPKDKQPEASDKPPEKKPEACHSFLPGTPVLLADGTRTAIEDVRLGDRVIVTDPVRGLTATRPVAATITTEDDKDFTRLTVTVNGRPATVTATDTHPFWLVDEHRWVDAADVRPGAKLRTSSGAILPVADVSHYRKQQRTHDLTLRGIHTYYVGVGAESALVHNNNDCGEWQARDDLNGPAAGKVLKRPNPRHTVKGAAHQRKPEKKNTVVLRGNERLVDQDIKAIAEGRARLVDGGNRYEVNGRKYGIEDSGRVYPDSGPGLVEMDGNEYAALIEIAKAKGNVNASRALKNNPRFLNNPEAVNKAKAVYDGTYR